MPTSMTTGMPTSMPTSMTAQPAAVAAQQAPVAATIVPKSGLCTAIPDCKIIADATADKEKICCGAGAKSVYDCCKGKGFTSSPTMFNTTSPTTSTASPSQSPTNRPKRMCIENRACQADSVLLFSDTDRLCYFDESETLLFPKGSKFNSSGSCTVAVHKNMMCCPNNNGVFSTCCDTSAPTSTTTNAPSTTTAAPSITTKTPTPEPTAPTSGPTTKLAPELCGGNQQCIDDDEVFGDVCCPFNENGLSQATRDFMFKQKVPSRSCCPCNQKTGNEYEGNQYSYVCKDRLF